MELRPTTPRQWRHFLALLSAGIIIISFSGRLQAQTCRVSCGVNSQGQKSFMEVYEYDFVQEKPSFPGGDSRLLEFINSTRRYPKEAYKARVQGRVTCSFVVNTDGSISHVRVLKGVEESLNNEAVRIFSAMPSWHPGRNDNQAVPVRVIWSIPFRR